MLPAEVPELLIRQRLDGRRVEGLPAARQGEVDRGCRWLRKTVDEFEVAGLTALAGEATADPAGDVPLLVEEPSGRIPFLPSIGVRFRF